MFAGIVFLIMDIYFWILAVSNYETSGPSVFVMAVVPLIAVALDLIMCVVYVINSKKALVVEKDKITINVNRKRTIMMKDVKDFSFVNSVSRTPTFHNKLKTPKFGTLMIHLSSGENIAVSNLNNIEDVASSLKSALNRYKEFEEFYS